MAEELYYITKKTKQEIERIIAKVDSINGIGVENSSHTISIHAPAARVPTISIPPTVIAAKLTSAVSGRIGWYNAKSAQGKAKSDATGDLAETDITPSWATSEDLLVAYVPDLGQGSASIDDFDDLTKAIVEGLLIGADTTTGKRIVLVAGASSTSLPIGQYQYMVYQMTASNAAGWDFTRAHP